MQLLYYLIGVNVRCSELEEVVSDSQAELIVLAFNDKCSACNLKDRSRILSERILKYELDRTTQCSHMQMYISGKVWISYKKLNCWF
jgi:hypothetical protein